MVNTKRTLATTFTSSGLPKDPMEVDHDVCVPVMTGISMNSIDVATPITSVGTTNLATTAGQVNTTIPVSLNNRPMPPRENPPPAPPTEGRTHVEQPPSTTTRSGAQNYARETGPGISEPAIGEPHVDLDKDLELARLKEVICQVGQTEEPHTIGCDVFKQ
uniref:Uncharacterized protein n=1 Tax=Cannabis sativa TaxID=3483 RepID=A0A803QGR5_CANSA